jgi:hypothetical protein
VVELASALTAMFNKMWENGEFPTEWNEGVLVLTRSIRKGTWESIQTIGLLLPVGAGSVGEAIGF